MRSRLRGDEPPIRAALPIRLTALSDPRLCRDPWPNRDPIGRALRCRFVPPILCTEAGRIPRGCVVAGSHAGGCGALGGRFEGASFYGASGTGRKVDTSSPSGELVSYLGISLDTH